MAYSPRVSFLVYILFISFSVGMGTFCAAGPRQTVVIHKPVKTLSGHRILVPRRNLLPHRGPLLYSNAALILDQATGTVLYEKNARAIMPIASITKLMTAMVVLDARQDLSDHLSISSHDIDRLRGSSSRLPVGIMLTRRHMLQLALMSSENRAASALARYYRGGTATFVRAMNRKAKMLGLMNTYFADPTGLSRANVSTARDLVRLVTMAYRYPLIRLFTTAPQQRLFVNGRLLIYNNTNSLVESPQWRINLSKTGFIREAGRCLVMHTWLNNNPTVIVLLNSQGVLMRTTDANRIRQWVEDTQQTRLSQECSKPRPGRFLAGGRYTAC